MFLKKSALPCGLAALAIFISPCLAEKKEKDPYKTKKKIVSVIQTVHPYFELENLLSKVDGRLRIGGMCFDRDQLYVTSLKPDRTNKRPDKAGQVFRLNNVLKAKAGQAGKGKLSVTPIITGLYEPAAITIVGRSLYVGTKTQILRFDLDEFKDKPLTPQDGIVLLDGLSTDNFHTYTIGFEKLIKDGKTYLCGNFTTAIVLGGKRAHMVPPNPEVLRGSTFTLGPITGQENPADLKLDYIAGGYRTPNGIGLGTEGEVYVADNQGIFNPANKLIRLDPGSFYGHYLYTENGRAAAFQPKDIDPEEGGSQGQSPTTVYLPQGNVARSPAQPLMLTETEGLLAPYHGQILLCEFTTGSLLRVFTEKVGDVWQGVVFKHSGGTADEKGNGGFTGGPNRISKGPDGNYYIGQIGAGGLWEFNGAQSGLQRLRLKPKSEVPADFNEILAVRVVDGGFEVEFLKPLKTDKLDPAFINASQWTYIPTQNYGGSPTGTQKLKVKSATLNESKTKATLLIDGLKDGREEHVIKKGKYSSLNTGWVVHLKFNPQAYGDSKLYIDEFWYTLHQKIGGQDLAADQIQLASAAEEAKLKYQSLCLSCHVARGDVWAAPDLKGILGRKQIVLRDGKEVEVTVDREYIINSIINPESEKVLAYKDAFMAQLGINRKEAEALTDFIIKQK